MKKNNKSSQMDQRSIDLNSQNFKDLHQFFYLIWNKAMKSSPITPIDWKSKSTRINNEDIFSQLDKMQLEKLDLFFYFYQNKFFKNYSLDHNLESNIFLNQFLYIDFIFTQINNPNSPREKDTSGNKTVSKWVRAKTKNNQTQSLMIKNEVNKGDTSLGFFNFFQSSSSSPEYRNIEVELLRMLQNIEKFENLKDKREKNQLLDIKNELERLVNLNLNKLRYSFIIPIPLNNQYEISFQLFLTFIVTRLQSQISLFTPPPNKLNSYHSPFLFSQPTKSNKTSPILNGSNTSPTNHSNHSANSNSHYHSNNSNNSHNSNFPNSINSIEKKETNKTEEPTITSRTNSDTTSKDNYKGENTTENDRNNGEMLKGRRGEGLEKQIPSRFTMNVQAFVGKDLTYQKLLKRIEGESIEWKLLKKSFHQLENRKLEFNRKIEECFSVFHSLQLDLFTSHLRNASPLPSLRHPTSSSLLHSSSSNLLSLSPPTSSFPSTLSFSDTNNHHHFYPNNNLSNTKNDNDNNTTNNNDKSNNNDNNNANNSNKDRDIMNEKDMKEYNNNNNDKQTSKKDEDIQVDCKDVSQEKKENENSEGKKENGGEDKRLSKEEEQKEIETNLDIKEIKNEGNEELSNRESVEQKHGNPYFFSFSLLSQFPPSFTSNNNPHSSNTHPNTSSIDLMRESPKLERITAQNNTETQLQTTNSHKTLITKTYKNNNDNLKNTNNNNNHNTINISNNSNKITFEIGTDDPNSKVNEREGLSELEKGEQSETHKVGTNENVNFFKFFKKENETIDNLHESQRIQENEGDYVRARTLREGGRMLTDPRLSRKFSKLKNKLNQVIEVVKKINSSENTILKLVTSITSRSSKFLLKKHPKTKKDLDLYYWLQMNGLLKFYEKFEEFDVRFEDLKLLNERKMSEMNIPASIFLSLTSSFDYTRWIPVLLSGNLFKKGHKRRNWKERYFVLLNNGVLFYYKKENLSNPIDFFKLENLSEIKTYFVEKKSWHVIQLFSGGESVFRFATTSQKVFSIWSQSFELFLP